MMCRSDPISIPSWPEKLDVGANSYMLVTYYNFSTDLE
jgi:hypothetical protein